MSAKLLSHVILGTNNPQRAMQFYDQVLGALGHERRWHSQSGAGYGLSGEQGIDTFWIGSPTDGNAASVGNGANVCFIAPNRHSVETFYTLALSLGGVSEGEPGIRPEVHKNFYACYVRDLDGNKIVAACHDPA
jgi:catechol 2,3-dioxygenase-like lactoylglutathione lyase family enzyme